MYWIDRAICRQNGRKFEKSSIRAVISIHIIINNNNMENVSNFSFLYANTTTRILCNTVTLDDVECGRYWKEVQTFLIVSVRCSVPWPKYPKYRQRHIIIHPHKVATTRNQTQITTQCEFFGKAPWKGEFCWWIPHWLILMHTQNFEMSPISVTQQHSSTHRVSDVNEFGRRNWGDFGFWKILL